MKKLLGILALALSVSGIASADQDVVKNIWVNQDVRAGFTDQTGDKANEIGNAGFRKKNITKVKSVTEVGTTLGLNDEWGLDANLYYKHDEGVGFADGKKTDARTAKDLIDANLSKNVKWGSLDTNTKLGVRHWTNKAGLKRTNSVGESNEVYFGPTFGMNLFNQNIKTTLEAVYFTQNGNADQDGRYYRAANDTNANHGWGANLLLGTDGTIAEGGYGKFSYDVELDHY